MSSEENDIALTFLKERAFVKTVPIITIDDSDDENDKPIKRRKIISQSYNRNKEEVLEPIPKCSNCDTKTLEQCLNCRVYFCSRKCMLWGFRYHLDDCISIAPHSADPKRPSPPERKYNVFVSSDSETNHSNRNDRSCSWGKKTDKFQHQDDPKTKGTGILINSVSTQSAQISNVGGQTRDCLPGSECKLDDTSDGLMQETLIKTENDEIIKEEPSFNFVIKNEDDIKEEPSSKFMTQETLIKNEDEIKKEETSNFDRTCNANQNQDFISKDRKYNDSSLSHNYIDIDGENYSEEKKYEPFQTDEISVIKVICNRRNKRESSSAKSSLDKSFSNMNSDVVTIEDDKFETSISDDDIVVIEQTETVELESSVDEVAQYDAEKLCVNVESQINVESSVDIAQPGGKELSEDLESFSSQTNVESAVDVVCYDEQELSQDVENSSHQTDIDEMIDNSQELNESSSAGSQITTCRAEKYLEVRLYRIDMDTNAGSNLLQKMNEGSLSSEAISARTSSVSKNAKNSNPLPSETTERMTRTRASPKKIVLQEQNVKKWRKKDDRIKDDKMKWEFLEHNGPAFPPPYERLPKTVKLRYDGQEMQLSENAEEVATFYSRFIDNETSQKQQFNENFFQDWRKSMTSEERKIITDLSKCDFRPIHRYMVMNVFNSEERKKTKEENRKLSEVYGVVTIDGRKEKIDNFKIESPGLFRGRGERPNPKMGKVKKRIRPEDVIINCSEDSKIPIPPAGHKWKEVRHDHTVTWLACWMSDVLGETRYIMLGPASCSSLAQKEKQKYELARELTKRIDNVRDTNRKYSKSKIMKERQLSVAFYFIDKLGLSSHEKNEDCAINCCSLRVKHVQLLQKDEGKYTVILNFPGKNSHHYYNEVDVDKRIFRNLKIFCEEKNSYDYLFDRVTSISLNNYLNELMEGLTTPVFKAYNVSTMFEKKLGNFTDADATTFIKVTQYKRACRAVAIHFDRPYSLKLGNSGVETSIAKVEEKIDAKKLQIVDAKRMLVAIGKDTNDSNLQKELRLKEKKDYLNVLENDLAALYRKIDCSTLKLDAFDPRISVAWCKKHGVPMRKIFSRTQMLKFEWAIDMADGNFVF